MFEEEIKSNKFGLPWKVSAKFDNAIEDCNGALVCECATLNQDYSDKDDANEVANFVTACVNAAAESGGVS